MYLGSRRHGEESLVAVAPLLHPALRTLGDDVGCLFLRVFLILQTSIFITEGDAVVIESHDHLCIRSDGCLILIGLIDAMQTLTLQHLVVVFHLLDEIQLAKRYVGQFQYLLFLIVNNEFLVNGLCHQFSVGRRHLLRVDDKGYTTEKDS